MSSFGKFGGNAPQSVSYQASTHENYVGTRCGIRFVGLGLCYSLAIDPSELLLGMTALIYLLMSPLAYFVYKNE